MMAAGYDVVTGVAIILGGVRIGVLAPNINPVATVKSPPMPATFPFYAMALCVLFCWLAAYLFCACV